ncbi:MAG: valine--tRNA ligase [Chloroflexi bacterium]|nr:valine--tRNA ligase [Chloroflexota bacterium]
MATRTDPRLESRPVVAPSTVGDYAPYNPGDTEAKWYDFWVERGLFKPENHKNFGTRAPFVVTMPPPNVTGGLHNGHTLFVTLEDIMVRWHRMLGDPSLWLPGRDHAGIAGQLVVERDLRTRGISRHDLGREKFLEQMWEWMETYGLHIQLQLRKLGASSDWSRDMFTMDPHHVRAVRTAFVRLFDKGLVYRGLRIANWCKDCATVLSDLEVEHKETKGSLTYFNYPVVDDANQPTGDVVPVATTRPETILGDVGVAVHPEDPRYRHLIGQAVLVPHVRRRGVIVADDAVDRAFGTGAVKLTPAHDPVDYEIAKRHDLPFITVMNLDGTMNAEAGSYEGVSSAQARKSMVAELGASGQLIRQEEYTHAVGHCQRSGTVLEPMLLDQWYLRIKPLAEPAIAAVRSGEIQIIPDRFTRVYFNWMENIRDWPISRQLWWGHRIPVYTCEREDCAHVWASVDEPDRCPSCGTIALRQDPDVLDTWFSSGLWPFSTLGWPDDTDDLRHFYPTSVMETGYDILFFWVARMIMFGLEFTGKAPFHTVYLHGLVKAEGGQKMSKTKGNVQDPLDLIEQYGTDALRLAVTIGNAPGNDFTLTPGSLEAKRDFVNKLWNLGRFVQANTTAAERGDALERARPLPGAPLADRWICSRLDQVIQDTTRLLGDFNFGEAGRAVYDFAWDELADWYVESFKVAARAGEADGSLLARVYEKVLRLLHPLAPFATEDLWQRLTAEASYRPVALMVADWPEPAGVTDPEAEARWAAVQAVVRAARTLRTDYRIEPARLVAATIGVGNGQDRAFWETQAALIGALPGSRLRPVEVRSLAELGDVPTRSIAAVAGGVELLVPAEGLFDVEAESTRVGAEIAEVEVQVRRLEGLLGGEFATKAPPDKVQGERERLAQQRQRLEALERRGETLTRLRGA